MHKIRFGEFFRFFFALALFCLPLGIRSLIYEGGSYEFGFFNTYTAFFLNVSEVFFLLAFLFFGLAVLTGDLEFKMPSKKFLLPFVILLAISVAVIPFSRDPLLALLHFYRILVFAFAAFLVGSGVVGRFVMVRILAAAFFIQAALAIGQFIAGGGLGLAFLGESAFDANTFNVAKIVEPSGEVLVRGMGTLPHANILGGLLALLLLLLANYPKKNLVAYFVSVTLLIGMFFTFSRAAYLAFFTGLIILLIFQFRRRLRSFVAAALIFALLLAFFGKTFLVRLSGESTGAGRVDQISQSLEIVRENPLGTGRGSYTRALSEKFPDLKFYEIQPVHNFFALKISEESVLVLLAYLGIFVSFAWWCIRQERFELLGILATIFVLANFDHYFSTSFSGEALFFLSFGFIIAEIGTQNKKHSTKNPKNI